MEKLYFTSMIRILRMTVLLFIPSLVFGQGFLRTRGFDIVNEKGEKVLWRGMGLGGWMLQEGYMLHLGNIGPQFRIKAKIAELIGQQRTDQFYDDWLANDIRKVDIDSMAAWGFNAVRLPMHYRLYTLSVEEEPISGKNTWLPKGFALTDSLLSWCKANHMYLILDMHAAPGGQGNDLPISDRDPSKPSLWDSEANRQKMVALWQQLATRYAKEPWIGGYDIINEPNWGFTDSVHDRRGTAETKNEPLRQLMKDITAAIRKVDPRHIIIIEGNGFGNNYRGVLPPWDDNMVLSFHKYWNQTTETSIRGFLDLREQYRLPLWLGESGENSDTWFTETIRLAEDHGIGWSWWPLKKMGGNNPLEIPYRPEYRKLVEYWSGRGNRPSEQEAIDALQGVLRDIRLENNHWHKEVTDAMFRQVYSDAAIPFLPHIIGEETTIDAVDFDLGRQGIAYYDKDSGNYKGLGSGAAGNRGGVYRNDGVDIRIDSAAGSSSGKYYIFHIEDGEWLQYTVNVEKEGEYVLGLTVASDADTGRLSFSSNQTMEARELKIPATGGMTEWRNVEVEDVYLDKGRNVLRIYAGKGGFNLKAIHFEL